MSLLRSCSPNKLINITRMLNALQQRSASHWVPDYKPGPYPKTKEERIAAAKKYNLLPEEYEPYSVEDGAGDYPKLPFESVDSKDPYHPYDHPELRRDFMEPVHRKYIILFPELISTEEPPYNYKWGLLQCISMFAAIVGFLWYMNNTYKFNFRVLEKQLPHMGETHYIFAVDHDWKKPVCTCDDLPD